MLDFTSALYLGLQHPSDSLRPWRRFTTGAPAALNEPGFARHIARELAELQGCAAALLAPSTLHVAWDLFGMLAANPITVLMDSGVYAISRWGAQRAAMRGAMVRTFLHHDASSLERSLATAPRDRTPVIVTDGVCPRCGRVAPLESYLSAARRRQGLLVIDDTQALGILGHSPNSQRSYGYGGGGTLRWCGINSPEILVYASLAKGFGVPAAVLAGSTERVCQFDRESHTRVHCSPPSVAACRAAEHALECNRRAGDALRGRLEQRVREFRRGVLAPDIALSGGLFPVQTIDLADDATARRTQKNLRRRGISAVLLHGEDHRPRLSFLLTARHTPSEIRLAARAIREVITASPEPIARRNGTSRALRPPRRFTQFISTTKESP